MLAAGDTAVHSGFSEFTYFPANLRLLPAFTAPAASTKFGLQIANQILLAIYNSYKTDLVLSIRRYSIPRRVRRREPRGAALRTGGSRCKLTFFVCGFVQRIERLRKELVRKLARFYLFFY